MKRKREGAMDETLVPLEAPYKRTQTRRAAMPLPMNGWGLGP
jgi:hypothetical protein